VAGQSHSVNMPWALDAIALAKHVNLSPERIVFLNDLVATAWGIQRLQAEDFLVLNSGVPQPESNKAVLAAGTGLGEAILFWDGKTHRVSASEGGMTDFAA